MTTNGDDTRPTNPATIARLRLVEQAQRDTRTQVESLDQAVTLLSASLQETEERLGAKVDLIRGDMRKGFERLGELIDRNELRHDREHRRTEDSHHDLEAEVTKTRRLIMLAKVSWPTAVVLAVILAGCFTLMALGKPVPTWVLGMFTGSGVLAGVLPALLGKGSQS